MRMAHPVSSDVTGPAAIAYFGCKKGRVIIVETSRIASSKTGPNLNLESFLRFFLRLFEGDKYLCLNNIPLLNHNLHHNKSVEIAYSGCLDTVNLFETARHYNFAIFNTKSSRCCKVASINAYPTRK